MKSSSAVCFVCAILVIEVAVASPLAEPCRGADGKKGSYACKEITTASDGCNEGQCRKNSSLQEKQLNSVVKRHHGSFDHLDDNQVCPDCSLKKLTIKEAFASAHFVVRGRVLRTRLMGVTHVLVVLMVQLVMKSTGVILTPGRMVVAVPLRSGWECDCPGVRNFEVKETYLITGFLTKKSFNKSSKYLLEVNHNSLVTQWKESILDNMVAHKSDYPNLKLVPSLELYRMLFVYW